MVAKWSKSGNSSIPPHELNVRKFAESRASELDSLHSIVSVRLNNDFKSKRSSRKRTNGHDNRVSKQRFRKRQKTGLENTRNKDSMEKDDRKLSRRVRRSLELKKNPTSGFCTSGDGTKRLRTHVWHAKRFTMKKLWGFHLPLGIHGRGKGSRSLLKKLKSGVLIHDASYNSTVQFEGPQDSLLSILNSVLVPPPSGLSEEITNNILSGHIFGSAVLHHVSKLCSTSITPVTYMWRPVQENASNIEDFNLNHTNVITLRKLWVWIHAAAFDRAYDTLRSACEKHMNSTVVSVKCISLEGQLANLEFVGSEVFQFIQKTLIQTSCVIEKSSHLKKCTSDDNNDLEETESAVISKFNDNVLSSAIIPLTVKDPRTSKYKQVDSFEIVDDNDLWGVEEGICPPMEENGVCIEKYCQRMKFIALGNRTSGSQIISVDGKYSRCCPILLLNDENYKDSIKRCSIILPLSWVKVFWNIFISRGAHVIGLREKHWIACEIGLPYFPMDFPDCDAYWCIMEKEAVTSEHKNNLRPPSKRPQEIPVLTPWDCVMSKLLKQSNDLGNSSSRMEQPGLENEVVDSVVRNTNCGASEANHLPFNGVIARTSGDLKDHSHRISGSDFILFPRIKDQNNCMYAYMKDEEFLKQVNHSSVMTYGRTRCFLRVLLKAYRSGVFEQGAVVCATTDVDITLLSRSDKDDWQLQISQSSQRSYFVKTSYNWEHQVPLDSIDKESYRQPIGFVTTGFVQGSKTAEAGAICEASLLSRLRLEQWKILPVRQRRKEIYVLVRNLRSTALRLALATIVLEQQEEDVKFM